MTKKYSVAGLILLLLFTLSGCTDMGNLTITTSVVYLVTSLCAALLLAGYFLLIKKRQIWFILLFSAVTIVNIGYFTLSISKTLNEALLSNRIAYLGSVFLPFSMLMAILKSCQIKVPRWLTGVLLFISISVFIIAASPGYLDIYYKEVTLSVSGGATVLQKVYGPLHKVYLCYLLGHFTAMLGVMIYSFVKKRVTSLLQAILIFSSVFVNISVWFIEQLVDIDFEFLSVSYIASEIFLLGFGLLIQEFNKQSKTTYSATDKAEPVVTVPSQSTQPVSTDAPAEITLTEKIEYMRASLCTLTPTESTIFNYYTEGKKPKEIIELLSITENTLKYHNRNIYSKLGVANRKEMLSVAIHLQLPTTT